MQKPVNLRQARKKKQRLEKQNQAAQNRIDFGRTKQERSETGKNHQKSERHLDQHKLDRP
jgi:hypothetical protein